MWRSLSFMLYVGSISALDFPQIGFCFVLAPKGSAGGGWGARKRWTVDLFQSDAPDASSVVIDRLLPPA